MDPRIVRTRQKAMAAARELLQEGGLPAVTVEAVAARSGVAKTSIYRQWSSRSELVVSLFTSLAPAAPPLDLKAPLREQLIVLLTEHGRQLEEASWSAALPALIAAADRDPELDGVRRQVVHGAQSPFADLLIAHREELGDVNPREAASQLFGPIIHRRLIDTGPIHRSLIVRVVDCFLACYRPTTETGPTRPKEKM